MTNAALNRNMQARLPLFALAALVAAVMTGGQAQTTAKTAKPSKLVLYAAAGPVLTQYDVDVGAATLTPRGSVELPTNVQYAWPHPSRRYLYVAWSNRTDDNGLSAFRIDVVSGALTLHGQPVLLTGRPIHLSTDIPGTHLLTAYNDPSGVTVHRLASDGTIGSLVTQPAPLDAGIYAHQVRVDPSNKMAILVTRGNNPRRGQPEDPGALKVFGYDDGVLSNRASIAPGGGFGFGPRHLDFWRSFVYVSLERQSTLQVYKDLADGTLTREPLFTKDSLSDRANNKPQAAGTVHVHPNGKFLYQANRASGTTDFEGKPVFDGGENSIVVYSINQGTGEPTMIQSIDTQGISPRTFAIDPSGRILIAANEDALFVREGQDVRTVSASLVLYRVGTDGKLAFARKYDVKTDGPPRRPPPAKGLLWMNLISLP